MFFIFLRFMRPAWERRSKKAIKMGFFPNFIGKNCNFIAILLHFYWFFDQNWRFFQFSNPHWLPDEINQKRAKMRNNIDFFRILMIFSDFFMSFSIYSVLCVLPERGPRKNGKNWRKIAIFCGFLLFFCHFYAVFLPKKWQKSHFLAFFIKNGFSTGSRMKFSSFSSKRPLFATF
jgi:hypothetical protein